MSETDTVLRVACAKLEGLKSSLEHRVKELESALKNERERAEKLSEEVRKSTSEKHNQDAETQTDPMPEQRTAEALSRELERLRVHMIEQEEIHTTQMLEAAKSEEDLRAQIASKVEIETCIPVLTTRCEEWQSYAKQKDAECQRLGVAIANLQAVLEQLQSDQEQIIARELRPMRAELDSCRAECSEARIRVARASEIERSVEELSTSLARARAEVSMRDTTIEELRAQVGPLQETLSSMATQMEGMSQHEDASVDKRVAKKLLVTYVARPGQRSELLELMDRILSFTEEEKEVLGLSKTAVPPSPSSKLKLAAQKSLAELWAEFLLKESGAEMTKPVLRKT